MLKFQDSMLTQESKVVQNQILHWVKPCTDVIDGEKSVKQLFSGWKQVFAHSSATTAATVLRKNIPLLK